MKSDLQVAADIIKKSKYLLAFTGAGISVESGIPPFRGEKGLWNKYNPEVLDIDYFNKNGEECWYYIREIFYDFFVDVKPNDAHKSLAYLEKRRLLKAIVTQNIDNLHQLAGSCEVYEFHGNSSRLVCCLCGKYTPVSEVDLAEIPPRCSIDNSILKPDFIFFGEAIPAEAYKKSFNAARKSDVCLIIGSTGEVMPAAYVPHTASQNGAFIIEINPEESLFTKQITNLHLRGRAGDVLKELDELLLEQSNK